MGFSCKIFSGKIGNGSFDIHEKVMTHPGI